MAGGVVRRMVLLQDPCWAWAVSLVLLVVAIVSVAHVLGGAGGMWLLCGRLEAVAGDDGVCLTALYECSKCAAEQSDVVAALCGVFWGGGSAHELVGLLTPPAAAAMTKGTRLGW